MDIDLGMAKKGRSVPLVGLRDQANIHNRLLSENEAELNKGAWTPELSAQFRDARAVVDDTRAQQLEAKDGSSQATGAESAAIDRAKKFKRKLLLAVADLAADGTLPVERKSFEAGAGLRRNTARISSYLGDLRPHVLACDTLLQPYFEGGSALAELDQVKAQLDARQATQEVALDSLPSETLKLYEAKGKLLRLIEKINRIAAIRFDGAAELKAKFNKDLILRARKKKPATPPVTPA
jgi:hypothetical protein